MCFPHRHALPPTLNPLSPAAPVLEVNPLDHVGLVYRVARSYQKSGLPYEDLVQEGMLGLLRACRKFDHTRGLRFATFACPVIRGSILNALYRQLQSRLRFTSTETLDQLPAREDPVASTYTAELLERLPEPERQAVALWIGQRGPPHSCRQIGKAQGYTRQRAHQLLRSGLKRLRRHLRNQ